MDNSRFFLFVVSPASMASYFVQKIELQSAFAKMISDKRKSFILPVICKAPKGKLPSPLNTFNYLDFTKFSKYMENIDHLVSRVTMRDERFTGVKIFKSMDVTLDGIMVGTGQELKSLPVQSASVKLYFENGRVRYAELYERKKLISVKTVFYDAKGRVAEISLLKKGRLVDTWRYEYGRGGRRVGKLAVRPGNRPHVRIPYDAKGNKGSEQKLPADAR